MNTRILLSLSVALAAALAPAGAQATQAHPDEEHPTDIGAVRGTDQSHVPLYGDLGDHHYRITTGSDLAQAYFDQGLRLYYAFNHQEGIRSFREAQRLDPACAMCWWGEALAWGPNINLPMDSASAVEAHRASRRAVELRDGATPVERSLIDALAVRYVPVPAADRAHLDRAYADAMAEVVRRWPGDPEAAVLWAESLMDLRPWDYWTEAGDPQSGIAEALAALQRVLALDDEHPGACHFFIHAVEKLYPERAVPCAERLAGLMPGAGHLVHMPGHIYIRVGRYLDAVRANRHAVHADESWIQDQNPAMGMYTAGYYPHNYDFMAFAAMMIGRDDVAVPAARKVATLLPEEMFGTPGMDFLQHWSIRPLLIRVRFAQWDELLTVPEPPVERAHARGLWHYSRGRALSARGDRDAALRELAALREILETDAVEGLSMEFNRSEDLLHIAERVLSGWIDARAGRFEQAIASLRDAVRREDALRYGEPPEWSVPTRQDLGAVLLRADRPAEAEATFREDLEQFPANAWSLDGLGTALARQGQTAEAERVRARFRRVWKAGGPELAAIFSHEPE